jgi:MFS family permease
MTTSIKSFSSPLFQRLLPYLVCFSASLFFAYELVQFHMMNAISPYLMKDLAMNATSFGQLCASYLLADVIFLLPAGIILDRFSTRKVILSALILCIIGTFGFSFANSFKEAAICHFLSGIGNAFCFLSCMMLVARWFSKEKQALIIGLVITMGMLGAVFAQYPVSLIAEMFSWRSALVADAVIGVGIFLLVYLFVHDGPKPSVEGPGVPFWQGVKKSVFNPQNILCGIYTCFMNMPLMVLSAVWGSLFLSQVHSIPLAKASFISGMIGVGTIIGSPLYGYLSNRTQDKKSWMTLGSLTSIFFMILIMFLPHPSELLLTTLFFGLGLASSSQVLGYPLITENSPKELTGTSMGIAAVIIMGLPMLIQPLSGLMLDLGWQGAMKNGAPFYSHVNFISAFAIFPIGFLLSFLSTYLIKEPKKIALLGSTKSDNYAEKGGD